MKAIILYRSKVNDDSLLLDTLLENGIRKKIKLPGILKSKNRYGFYLTPAVVWDFIITNLEKNILIPKESEFLSSPYSDSPTYDELLLVSDLLFPLLHLTYGYDHQNIFFYYFELITNWRTKNLLEQYDTTIHFYLYVLEQGGFLNKQTICCSCSRPLENKDFYSFSCGGICINCATGSTKDNFISFANFFYMGENFDLGNLETKERILAEKKKTMEIIKEYMKGI